MIANVVGNALTHTPAGTPIELRARSATRPAEIAITDHGPGMAPEVASKVTERFYRADPARARDRGGSGLGLAIVDATVDGARRVDHRRQRPGHGHDGAGLAPPARRPPAPADRHGSGRQGSVKIGRAAVKTP